ncbi:thiolase C-terminal domain-containing protein [Parahaliea mediterranea]|uniref:thiolase C-terminal domain-containing protein n=1 Tax=Parahaliea mediterranea TaxID=651086 RepID=UPI000E2E54C0|nr:lipid-transfer protein [Parahaliea mediterranea]
MRPEADWGQASALADIRGQVAIAGIGEAAYSGASNRNSKAMAAEAIARCIADAGLRPEDIDGIMYSGALGDQFTADDFRAHFGTTQAMWESGQGGGMVWAATAPAQAAEALRSGRARYIVNSFAVDWASRRGAMTGGPGAWHASELIKAQLELPFGWFPQPLYFATFASRHMHDYGTTEAQLGELVTAFRRHANGQPGAVMQDKTLSLEDYLARPHLASPLRVEDCCLISDGGAAYLMTSPERAQDLPQRPVSVEGVGHGIIANAPYISQQGDITSTPQHFAAPGAYAMAGIGPEDIDVLGVYDCFSITALMQIEDMGFCAKGEGGPFVEGGRLDFKRSRHQGGLPTNTHGGLLSHAYVLGIAHVVELVKQLRGQAANQVEQPRRAAYAGFTADEAGTLILGV